MAGAMAAIWNGTAIAWEDPCAGWPTLGPPTGTLVIAGGAAPVAIYRDFLERCGGPDAPIVVIPTASNAALTPETNQAWQRLVELGATQLTMLHTTDRAVADTAGFCEPVRKARGVFISGAALLGDRLADAGYRWESGLAMLRGVAVVPGPINRRLGDSLRPWMEQSPEAFALTITPETMVTVRGAEIRPLTDAGTATVVRPGQGEAGFTLDLVGLPARSYLAHASEDLVVWEHFATAEADEIGALQVIDPQAVDFTSRFYRFSLPPP